MNSSEVSFYAEANPKMQNHPVYLFPCSGFASPQLDVPCYQFIATWKRDKGCKMKNDNHRQSAGDPCQTEGGTIVVEKGSIEPDYNLRSGW